MLLLYSVPLALSTYVKSLVIRFGVFFSLHNFELIRRRFHTLYPMVFFFRSKNPRPNQD
jgi:hypothetical protein